MAAWRRRGNPPGALALVAERWHPCAVKRVMHMGISLVQGKLWGGRARDFAELAEQVTLPLMGAALDAAHVTRDIRLLERRLRGRPCGRATQPSRCHGDRIDASPALLAVARERLPTAEFREGDLEELPFADASFDAVVAINSVFFAADMEAAMRKLVRVVRPGGRVVVTAWGPPERCEIASAVFPRLRPLAPRRLPAHRSPQGLASPPRALWRRSCHGRGCGSSTRARPAAPSSSPAPRSRFGPTAVPGSTSPRCSSIAGSHPQLRDVTRAWHI